MASKPTVSSKVLSEYMVATEIRKRSLIRDCKYRKIARVIQHGRAKGIISDLLIAGIAEEDRLREEASRLRRMIADTEFERDTLDVNADFLDAYAKVFSMSSLPKGVSIRAAPKDFSVSLGGVELRHDIRFSTERLTRTNRVRTGFGTLRYAKGRETPGEVLLYHSSLLFGCRKMMDSDDETAPEEKLCFTLDCFSGMFVPAPGDATRRFQNMEAACASIAERWDSIEPPENAILG